MSRLVAISNRVGPVRGAARAGGLAVALVDALRERGGLWFGWSGKTSDGGTVQTQATGGLTLATIDLTESQHEDYYSGFANRCLWPLFHYRTDLTVYDRQYFDSYHRVNARFASAVAPLLRDDDLIWVHDYHLFLLATELRGMGAKQRIGFFLHIPLPPREILVTLPHHGRLMRSLFSYDVVGFQTEGDRLRFEDYVLREAGGELRDGYLHLDGRRLRALAFPIGIDARRFQEFSFGDEGAREFEKMRAALRGRDQIIGVDRLDYTKGLLRRMRAYERLLERDTGARGKVEFLQVAPVSRGDVQAYSDFRTELEQAAGRINGSFGEYDWTPVRYMNRALPRRTLAGLYRASRIGLVTPLRDGMNLVAKEYIAAQDPSDPGVLVLSRFAGAAQQMQSALIVNPYDIDEVSEAMQQARAMELPERQRRYEQLMHGLVSYDVKRWSDDFIATLESQP